MLKPGRSDQYNVINYNIPNAAFKAPSKSHYKVTITAYQFFYI